MIPFVKNHSLKSIKHKLLLLYVLNVIDIIFTLLLLKTGLFMEANALMVQVVECPKAAFALKVVLPAVLFILVYYRMQQAAPHQLKQSNLLISGAAFLYLLINISHIVWLVMIPILASRF